MPPSTPAALAVPPSASPGTSGSPSALASALVDQIAARFDATHDFGFRASCLLLATVGSQSHGTTLPADSSHATSDVDLFAVVLPPPSYLLGLDTFDNWSVQFDDLDVTVYSFHKFCHLLLKSNPSVLTVLWVRPEDVLLRSSAWDTLVANRLIFSSQAAHDAFAGYAKGQLHKMTAYSPEIQAEMDDLEAQLAAAGWHLQDIMDRRSVPMPRGLTPDDATRMADRLRSLRARYHAAYMGEKRRGLVRQHGWDVKNGAHLIRLLGMCVEFLQDGVLRVYRTHDAAHLMAIKRGEVPLAEVQQEAATLFAAATAARDASPLPRTPDRHAISEMVTRIILETGVCATPMASPVVAPPSVVSPVVSAVVPSSVPPSVIPPGAPSAPPMVASAPLSRSRSSSSVPSRS